MWKRWVHRKIGDRDVLGREVHWEVRMISILGKVDMTKVTTILG
jgi:hypothetical protein